MPVGLADQKRALDTPMELGLGVTLSHHVDADNKCSLLLRQLLNGTIALLKTHSSLSI